MPKLYEMESLGTRALPPRRGAKKRERVDGRELQQPAPRIEAVNVRRAFLFGPPGVGCSTLARILLDCSERELVLHDGVEVLKNFKDVCPGAFELFERRVWTPDDIQKLFDEGAVYPGGDGLLVHVNADFHAVRRRLQRQDETFTGLLEERWIERWHEWRGLLGRLDERIRALDLPCVTIQNDELDAAVAELARRLGVTK